MPHCPKDKSEIYKRRRRRLPALTFSPLDLFPYPINMSNNCNPAVNDAHSPAPDGGPVAWFQSPGVPGNGPNPQLETYIYQGEGKQEGSGPVGVAWTPSNPSPGTSVSQGKANLDRPPISFTSKNEEIK
ncbi:hypothetical protein CTheo_7863 [Ceratobasidium theobromae]|uniref:Uncharacterized protein n=1 Tax=Ceratobasidium theobromae TaxID=1582974 RepID=A0A5N5QAD0_9AGAM|nr:hypothetical protein CTheo_7863 [Ceratobasidium theobromae]